MRVFLRGFEVGKSVLGVVLMECLLGEEGCIATSIVNLSSGTHGLRSPCIIETLVCSANIFLAVLEPCVCDQSWLGCIVTCVRGGGRIIRKRGSLITGRQQLSDIASTNLHSVAYLAGFAQ